MTLSQHCQGHVATSRDLRFGVADDTNGAAQSTLPMMDKIRPPRRLTSADVPRLADRIKDVWQTDGQHRSFGEWVVHVSGLVVIGIAGMFIWASSASAAQKVIESLAVLLLALLVATPILLKLRFHP